MHLRSLQKSDDIYFGKRSTVIRVALTMMTLVNSRARYS